MPIFPQEFYANPQILVGVPPAENLPPIPDQEYNQAYWHLTQNAYLIDDDSCASISAISADLNFPLLAFYIKTITRDVDQTDIDSLTVIDNIPPIAGSFLDGAGDPILTPDTARARYDKMPSGITVDASLNLIATPYHGPEYWTTHNGVVGIGYPGKPSTVYEWTIDDEENDFPLIRVDPDAGAVTVRALPRKLEQETLLHLYTATCEANTGKIPTDLANDEVNAFTLFLSVQPGTTDGMARVPAEAVAGAPDRTTIPPWKVTLIFGDVRVDLIEGEAEAKITIKKSDPVTVPIDLDRVVSSRLGAAQDRQYGLTFIPVWNGLLVSDRNPRSDDFGDVAVYIPLDPTRSIYTEMAVFLEENSEDSLPRFGTDRVNLSGQFPVDFDDTTRLDTGDVLSVGFTRCGGAVRFAPIFFVPQVRVIFPMSGDAPSTPESPEDTGCTDDKALGETDVPEIPNFTVVPIYYLPSESQPDVSSGVYVTVPGVSPVWVVSERFSIGKYGLRRPAEVWGFLLYGSQGVVPGYRNAEGALTDSDLPQERIQSVDVSRSLDDGTGSGTIVWDNYDPLIGSNSRPPQNVGAVQIAVVGGVNTIPGVIFTGIGIGNSEEDTANENAIRIPLRGRDVKLRDEDVGIRLINSPFFDGLDHKVVMKWLCDYAGIPFETHATDFSLPTGPITAPIFNFRSNTSVWQAIQEIAEKSVTLVFFDRFGTLQQYDVGQTSGMNWTYAPDQILAYSDSPELLSLANAILVMGLVTSGPVDARKILAGELPGDETIQLRLAFRRPPTDPEFSWDKQAFIVMPGTLPEGEFRLAARRAITLPTRARATAEVTIPGNAEIELLDTFNDIFVVTRIGHNVTTGQSKNHITSLGLELLIDRPVLPSSGNGLGTANPSAAPAVAAKFPIPWRGDS